MTRRLSRPSLRPSRTSLRRRRLPLPQRRQQPPSSQGYVLKSGPEGQGYCSTDAAATFAEFICFERNDTVENVETITVPK